MQKLLFTTLLFATIGFSYGQNCSYGTASDETANGENISTGGAFEYAGAVDFDVPFGIDFTTNQVTVNLLKGEADLIYVNAAFLTEVEGLPGDVIESFDNLIPTSQELIYATGTQGFDVYQITLDLPVSITFGKGKYFLRMAAAPGDADGAWWEITSDYQTYGVFDYFKFENEAWGGTGYYNKVFQVIGNCEDSGDVPPDYGDVCEQENLSNNHETGVPFIDNGQLVSIADDFIVPENTTFYLTQFNLDALLLGGGLHNATIKIRASNGNMPGDVLYSYINKGPAFEEFGDYWPFPGSPFDVAAIKVGFTFEEPIVLEEGIYFIEVVPTPYATDLLTWEATTQPGIGSYSYSSADGGSTWSINNGYNQVFKVEGFCAQTLGTETPNAIADLQYYPNPMTDVLNISSETNFKQIALYNLVGQKVADFNAASRTINMEFLTAGVYLLKAEFDNGAVEISKIIKR